MKLGTRLIIGVSLIVVAVIFLDLRFMHPTDEDRITADLSHISACMQQRNDSVLCTRQYVRDLLSLKNSNDAMDMLSTRLNSLQCHFVGHIVGQLTYNRYQDVEVAMNRCDRACDDACIHGVVGESFAEELGYTDPNVDLEHLSPADIEKVGTTLCRSHNTCHGVGHVLFQSYKKFDPALAMCDKVSPGPATFCYSGVFMEYADILSERNMRTVSGVSFPQPSELVGLCTGQSTSARARSCFLYFPRIVLATLTRQGFSQADAAQRVRQICASYPQGSDARSACFSGYGASFAYILVGANDPKVVGKSCEFPDMRDQAACDLGVITIDVDNRQDLVFPFCAALGTDSLQKTCYQGVFSHLFYSGVQPRQASSKYCREDDACLFGAKNYAIDPFKVIQETFGS